MDVLEIQSSQVNIPWLLWKSSVEVAMSSTEAIQRAAAPALQVEIPTAVAAPTLQVEIPTTAVATNSPDPSVGEEGLQADLDTAIRVDASCLDLKVARILSEAVVATWEVHRLWQILPTASRVPGYSEKPITQKNMSVACLIIEILA
jgi:hypothetical protein